MRALQTLVLCGLLGAGVAAADEDRDENAVQLRRVLRAAGVEVNPAVDRRLASLSDREIAELVAAHDRLGWEEGPLLVIGAGVILLVLFVFLMVTVVK